MPTKPPCEYMDNAAVKAYRDKFRYCPDRGTRRDIAVTVQDQALWLKVLNGWRYQKENGKWANKNPLAVKNMLSEYELLEEKQDAIRQESSGVHRTESIPERVAGRVSEQRMPVLLARESGWK